MRQDNDLHRQAYNAYQNAARLGRYAYRREEYLRARAEGRTVRFPVRLIRC